MNLKNITDDLMTLGRLHKQIQSIGIGDYKQLNYILQYVENEENVNNKPAVYPLMYINPQTSNTQGGFKTYSINLIVIDIINQDMTNEVDVMSDCDQMADDILSAFKFPTFTSLIDNDYDVDTNITKTFVSEKYDDYVSGVIFSIQVTIPEDLNRCIAAFDNDLNPPTPPVIPDGGLILQEDGGNILTEDNNNLEQE